LLDEAPKTLQTSEPIHSAIKMPLLPICPLGWRILQVAQSKSRLQRFQEWCTWEPSIQVDTNIGEWRP
jgi:hypothetical protein